MEVVKFTTHDGEVFYVERDKVNDGQIRKIVEANREQRTVYQLDLLDMDEDEWRKIPASNASTTFFSGLV